MEEKFGFEIIDFKSARSAFTTQKLMPVIDQVKQELSELGYDQMLYFKPFNDSERA